MSEFALEIRELHKTFRSSWTYRKCAALSGVNFSVRYGEAFGFLGHNGAGKTTTLKCIVGLIRPTSGSILLNGEPLVRPEQRARLGFLPELPYFYDHLTVHETLTLFANLLSVPHPKNAVSEVLSLVGLSHRRNTLVRELSKGLEQRLGIAQALINRPSLLLLDEPFSGLDPLGRAEIRSLFLDLKRRGTTLFLSSHILSDIEEICDRVAILAKGTLRRIITVSEPTEEFELLVVKNNGHGEEIVRNRFTSYAEAESALRYAVNCGERVSGFRPVRRRLEDAFLEVAQEAGVSLP
jgi:ABC-2 type transport system ATP-binding protein